MKKITSKSAYQLLEIACYFRFTDIKQRCSELINLHDFSSLQEEIPIEAALKMYPLALMHDDLKTVVKESIMCEKLQELSKTDEFLDNAGEKICQVSMKKNWW